MIAEATTVEHDCGNPSSLGLAGDEFTDLCGLLALGTGQFVCLARSRQQRFAGHIIDYLGINMRAAAEDAQPWADSGALDLATYPAMSAQTKLTSFSYCHVNLLISIGGK